jgi:hypothetical protein
VRRHASLAVARRVGPCEMRSGGIPLWRHGPGLRQMARERKRE